MKLYAVFTGEWEMYDLDCIFDDLSKAQEYLDAHFVELRKNGFDKDHAQIRAFILNKEYGEITREEFGLASLSERVCEPSACRIAIAFSAVRNLKACVNKGFVYVTPRSCVP